MRLVDRDGLAQRLKIDVHDIAVCVWRIGIGKWSKSDKTKGQRRIRCKILMLLQKTGPRRIYFWYAHDRALIKSCSNRKSTHIKCFYWFWVANTLKRNRNEKKKLKLSKKHKIQHVMGKTTENSIKSQPFWKSLSSTNKTPYGQAIRSHLQKKWRIIPYITCRFCLNTFRCYIKEYLLATFYTLHTHTHTRAGKNTLTNIKRRRKKNDKLAL